jgi:hypothetical protein
MGMARFLLLMKNLLATVDSLRPSSVRRKLLPPIA